MSETYLEPAAWFATLPSVFISASMLLTDADDRVLLVKPNYRPGWNFPGGITEENEAPHDCAAREIVEELGLSVEPGDLLVVHWSPPLGERPRPLVNFLFDGGVVADPSRIRVQAEELDEVAFFPWEEGIALLPSSTSARLRTARLARADGHPHYLAGGSDETAE
ncbi:NUDIX domain-containing protein [Streptosporangium sp. NPDC050855]|uniref:NUDIX domain-containing protein n=1 Tax=Streptosporangium sp. NPDC050855 TaxID=3366194 RepID=UPI00379DF3E0